MEEIVLLIMTLTCFINNCCHKYAIHAPFPEHRNYQLTNQKANGRIFYFRFCKQMHVISDSKN